MNHKFSEKKKKKNAKSFVWSSFAADDFERVRWRRSTFQHEPRYHSAFWTFGTFQWCSWFHTNFSLSKVSFFEIYKCSCTSQYFTYKFSPFMILYKLKYLYPSILKNIFQLRKFQGTKHHRARDFPTVRATKSSPTPREVVWSASEPRRVSAPADEERDEDVKIRFLEVDSKV